MRFKFILLVTAAFCCRAAAQDADPESSKVEISGSYWAVNSSGTIRANGTPVDLESDLGVNQAQATFTGRLVVAPRRRQKIVTEGTPFRLTGFKDLSRSISYAGKTYSVTERLDSSADLNYFYGGYQFDFVSRPAGHFGVGVGGAWLNAEGRIRGQTSGITASKTESIGLPLAGLEVRAFPVRRRVQFEVNGDFKGMSLGSYGHYVQAYVATGLGMGPLLIEGGYRIVNIDIHTSDNSTAVSPQFTGPIVSVVFRIR